MQLLPEFSTANAGLLYDFQLINVEDFQGVGESEPNPYFYQVRKNRKLLSLFCIFLAELLPKSVLLNHLDKPLNKAKLDLHLTHNTQFSISDGLKIYTPKKRNLYKHTKKEENNDEYVMLG